MERSTSTLGRWLMPAAALILTALGIAAQLRGDGGWGGFIYGPDRVIAVVEPGSAADAAGLRQGDLVVSVDGRPAEDLPMQSRWASTRAGAVHRLVVERGGAQVSADVVYRSRGTNRLALGAAAVMLAFLWCGVWAGLTVSGAHSLALARIGLVAGVMVAAWPNVGGTWNGVLSHVQLTSFLLLFILLLRFFLAFPKPKRIAESTLADLAMLCALAFLVGFEVLEMVVHPRLYLVTGTVGSLLMLAFACLALAALAHTVATTPRAELRPSGMGLVLLGVGAGVAAFLVAIVGTMARIPGAGHAGLLFAALPIALALAVRRQARAG